MPSFYELTLTNYLEFTLERGWAFEWSLLRGTNYLDFAPVGLPLLYLVFGNCGASSATIVCSNILFASGECTRHTPCNRPTGLRIIFTVVSKSVCIITLLQWPGGGAQTPKKTCRVA